jgi:CBS domain-containing protein
MVRSRVHRLMVVDNEKRLLGIVSTMDILAAFADGAPG